ncbi:MAG: hypothetical protein FWE09_10030, partial [Treponema sp.]|nr:hypothetical protein [Treponema sp.]
MEKKRFLSVARVLVFLAICGIGALVLIPAWRLASGALRDFRDGLIGSLEAQLGREISFSSIGPSIFGALDVRDLSVAQGGQTPVLSVARMRVSYSLLDLLLGRPLSIRSLRLDAPNIDFDLSRDADILDLFSGAGDDLGFQAALPESLTLELRNGRLALRSSAGVMRIDELNVVSSLGSAGLDFDAWWNLSLASGPSIVAPGAPQPVSLRLAMRLSGSGSAETGEGSGYFEIPSISGDISSSGSLGFALDFRDGSLSLRNDSDDLPFGMTVDRLLSDGGFFARAEFRDLRPADLISASGALAPFQQILEIGISGSADFWTDGEGGLGYALDISGSADFGEGLAAYLEIDAQGDDERALVRSLSLVLPDTGDPEARFFGSASFSGGVELSPFAPSGLLSFDGFSAASLREVRADIEVRSGGGEISLWTDGLSIGNSDPAVLGATLKSGDPGLEFDAWFEWPVPGGRPGLARALGNIDSDPWQLSAALSLDAFPAQVVALAFTAADAAPPALLAVLGDARVDMEAIAFTDFAQLSYSVPALAISGGDFSAELSFFGTQSEVDLLSADLVIREENLRLSGGARFDFPGSSGGGLFDFRLYALHQGISHYVEGELRPGMSARIRGSGGLDLSLDAREGGGLYGLARAREFPVPFLGSPAFVSIEATLDLGGPDDWLIEMERLEALNVSGPAGPARMLASGWVGARGATFPFLLYED